MNAQGRTQGRCNECRLIYSWKGKPLLRDAYCLHCRKALKRAVKMLKLGRALTGWTLMCSYPSSAGTIEWMKPG